MSTDLPFVENQLAQPVRLTSFHKFPDLPQDMRILIWESAIRPLPSENYNAVHKFGDGGTQGLYRSTQDVYRGSSLTLVDSDGRVIRCGNRQCTCNIQPYYRGGNTERDEITPVVLDMMSGFDEKTRSTFFWDYGMWTACTESRWVICRRFKKKQWSEIREDVAKDVDLASRSHNQPWKVQKAWQKKNRISNDTDKTIGRKEWYRDFASVYRADDVPGNIVATHPAKDLFIIGDRRWRSPAEFYTQVMPLQSIQEAAILFFRDNFISPTLDGYPMIENMGFVYDNTWTNGITLNDPRPTTLSNQLQSKNPRGHFLLLLRLCVIRVLKLRLWLIDYNFEPRDRIQMEEDAEEEEEQEEQQEEVKAEEAEKKEPKVFYNYGEEDLVEVDVKSNVVMTMRGNRLCILGTCCGFTYYLSKDLLVIPPSNDPRAAPFNVWDHVGVLAPKSRVLGGRIDG
ncbi:hypothetical protein IL306_006390 [Fusarium sp. DS 682]|nr:hypothetical protein IL306_006390 [Fusarium sp. DS 682]